MATSIAPVTKDTVIVQGPPIDFNLGVILQIVTNVFYVSTSTFYLTTTYPII